ncbi:MAG TPA: hypothetical protein VLE97_07120 [Gaiellaceae bacterium]|nr:hypothetical protein [Gaiellaceae bacterium]
MKWRLLVVTFVVSVAVGFGIEALKAARKRKLRREAALREDGN